MNRTVKFNLNLFLLSAKVDTILDKQGYKRDALLIYGIACIEIIFTILTKVVILYIWTLIIKVEISSVKNFISEYKVCFANFLIFN